MSVSPDRMSRADMLHAMQLAVDTRMGMNQMGVETSLSRQIKSCYNDISRIKKKHRERHEELLWMMRKW